MMDAGDSLQTPVINFRDFPGRVYWAVNRLDNLGSGEADEWVIRESLKSLFEALPPEREQAEYIDNMFNSALSEQGENDKVSDISSNPFIKCVRDVVRYARFVLSQILAPIDEVVNSTRDFVANDLDLKHDTVHTYKRFIDFCTGIDKAVSNKLGDWLKNAVGEGFRHPFGQRVIPADAATDAPAGDLEYPTEPSK
jgi:hypothetical protein